MHDQERLGKIWDCTVEKLKEVVQEFKITEDELHHAGDFLDRAGKAGVSRSLIDVALALSSIEATRHTREGTRFNLTGPYHAKHRLRPDGNFIDVEPDADAPRLALEGVVKNALTGQPIAGAELDFWQADHRGIYDRKGQHLRGLVLSDDAGHYRVRTLLPNDYSEHDFDPLGELFRAMGRTNTRAAHLHLKVRVKGVEVLTTQLFMSTSNMLTKDYVVGAVTDDLVVALQETNAQGTRVFTGRFDIGVVIRSASMAPA